VNHDDSQRLRPLVLTPLRGFFHGMSTHDGWLAVLR